MIITEISPLRRLFQAGMFVLVGSMFISGARHHMPPGSTAGVTAGLFMVGVAIEAMGAWLAWTAVRWFVAILRIYLRGPKR